MTSPSTDNFYAPLGDNPFHDDSGDDSESSPPLLSSDDPPTGDDVRPDATTAMTGDEFDPDTVAAMTGTRATTPPAPVTNTATMGAMPGGLPHGTPVVDDDASPTGPPPALAFGVMDAHDGPPADATLGSPASMMAAFRSIIDQRDAGLARLLEQQRALLEQQRTDFAALVEQHSTEIARSVDALRSTTNSNHGHVTKRLFPELEQRITSLESSLASTASDLAAKGESLLASTIDFETRIATLEATAPPWANSADFPRRQREPPDDDTTLPAKVPHAPSRRSPSPLTGDHPIQLNGPATDDDTMDVTARTRLVYERARALNTPPRASDPTRPAVTPRRVPTSVSRTTAPVRNPYHPSTPPRPSLRQTTIPETMGQGGLPRVPAEDFDTSGIRNTANQRPGCPVVGGPVISPRHRDRDLRARTLGASRFDVINLACAEYHVGMDGVPTLTDEILVERGFAISSASVDDVVVCYNDIILAHRKIAELWYNGYAHTTGPQVDRIIQKSLSVFPRLESTRVADAVEFYDRLQEVSLSYVIALLPFDAIVLSHGFEGLCPPGLGLVRYAAMSKALMELVPRLVHSNLSPQLNATLASVRFESNNGYDYVWRVLELTVPGFDPTVPVRVPAWSDAEDIFHFAQAFLLYFRLQAKMKFHYDERTRSGMFLRAIQYTDFSDTVTTLLSHVNSFRTEYDDGYLPQHLRLHGLATSIHQTTQGRLRDIISPRVRRVAEDDTAFSYNTVVGTAPRVQGVPTVFRLAHDDQPHPGGRLVPRNDRLSDVGDSRRRSAPANPSRGRGPAPRGPGRLARPYKNRRPFLPDVQCAACKRVGHVAKHCDMLATAICLERYMKCDMSPAIRDSIEKEWLDRWRDRLGNPSATPRQVLRAYVEELDITVAGLDDQMDWDAWAHDDADVPAVE